MRAQLIAARGVALHREPSSAVIPDYERIVVGRVVLLAPLDESLQRSPITGVHVRAEILDEGGLHQVRTIASVLIYVVVLGYEVSAGALPARRAAVEAGRLFPLDDDVDVGGRADFFHLVEIQWAELLEVVRSIQIDEERPLGTRGSDQLNLEVDY